MVIKAAVLTAPGKHAQLDKIAQAALFLASDDSALYLCSHHPCR